MIKDNLNKIKFLLPPGVTLIAVSKTKSNREIIEAYEAGQREFGENYVQELCDKHDQLPKDIHWHFIGHLQTNKVKFIAPFVHLIHSVDSLKLLKEINKQGIKNNRVINCLLQVYIAREETKFGLDINECQELLRSEELKKLTHAKVIGFMGMASNTENTAQIRKEFQSLKKFQQSLITNLHPLNALSFGMSNDYKIAIEEGSTMIRVGSSIFGERDYLK